MLRFREDMTIREIRMTRTPTATIVNQSRVFLVFVIAAVFLTTPALFGPVVSFGQEGGASTTEPPRPKVDEIATVNLGRGGYDLPIFIQQGKMPENKDAHVYYTPLVYLVVDKAKIRNRIDEDGKLTLFVRWEEESELIEEAVRNKLMVMAKEKNPAFVIEPGTKPYRIDVLPISVARFRASDRRDFVSERLRTSFTERGDIPIFFYLASSDEAEEFVEDLQNNEVSLVFEYGFSGVSDEICTARLEVFQIQDIDLFKEVEGGGGKGKIARHQVADIADQIANKWKLTSRCADYATASELADSVLEALGASETLDAADWDKLDEEIAFDPDSFRADIETEIKNMEKTVARDLIEKAWSEADSKATSKVTEGGGAYSLGVLMDGVTAQLGFGASGSDARASSKSHATARKDFQDILRRKGVSTEWTGKKFIPKSVDVYSMSALQSAWGRTFEKTIALTAGEIGNHEVILTENAWTEPIPPQKERQIEERLEGFTGQLAEIESRVKGIMDQQRDLTKRVDREGDDVLSKLGDIRLQLDNKVRDALRVETCHYEFELDGEGRRRSYHYDLGRYDDLAISLGVSGSAKRCNPRYSRFRVWRIPGTSRWGLYMSDMPRPCKFWYSVAFLNGAHVNTNRKDKEYASAYKRKIKPTREWCD